MIHPVEQWTAFSLALMSSMWPGVVLVVAWFGSPAFAMSLNGSYLEGGNWTCKSCIDTLYSNLLRPLSTCLCDEDCAVYGDCCPDSPYFEQQQHHDVASFTCVESKMYGAIYMRSTCPAEWTEPNTRAACESDSENIQDHLASFPATDLHSGIIYRNLFCAICHNATDLDIWHPEIECYSEPEKAIYRESEDISNNLNLSNISKPLSFSYETQSWKIDLNGKFHSCVLFPASQQASQKFIRRCIPYKIHKCLPNSTSVDLRKKCESYTSIVFSQDRISYKNPHCGICNNVPLDSLQCFFIEIVFSVTNSFPVLFDISHGPPGSTQPCDDDQLYDPFFKRCRRVLGEIKKTFLNTTPIMKCNKFILNQPDYIFDEKVVYVEKYRKTFYEGEFNIKKDSSLEICADSIGVRFVDKFDPALVYLTFTGLVVSIIFLLLHLIAFILVPDMRNFSGKNIASLSVALLIAYTSFVAGRFLQGDACLVVAVLTLYSFLASFMWMLTMSFDLWRTLRLATSKLRLSPRKQLGKFIAYSLWSWLFPALVVMIALLVDLSPGVSVDWKPEFAVASSCWFGHTKPLLIFFAIPLAIVMLLNFIFFVSSARMVCTSRTMKPNTSTHRDFRMYSRLAVMMGLTWVTGLVAGTLDVNILWYLFTILNTLQGLFIFLAFTCKDKVVAFISKNQK